MNAVGGGPGKFPCLPRWPWVYSPQALGGFAEFHGTEKKLKNLSLYALCLIVVDYLSVSFCVIWRVDKISIKIQMTEFLIIGLIILHKFLSNQKGRKKQV